MTDEKRRTNTPTSVLYDREAVLDLVQEVAADHLSGESTVEVTAWGDGDFQVKAFHTIDATYPFEEEAQAEGRLDGDDARPFYRERIRFSTADPGGYVYQEVVRRRTGRTATETVYSDRVAWVSPSDRRTRGLSDSLSSPYDRAEVEFPESMVAELRKEAGVPDPEQAGQDAGLSASPNDVVTSPPYGGVAHSFSLGFDVPVEETDEFRRAFGEGL